MVENLPLISVILCFYNEERFLTEAVQSVLAQDYTNWELLLVDDGSSDKSVMQAKAFCSEFPGKVVYVEHENHTNKGLSASRNAGIKKAKGEYVAFLDADDVWLPEKLSFQYNLFRTHQNITVVLEASSYWYSWNNPELEDVIIPVGAPEGIYDPPALMEILYPLGKGAAPCPSGIMVHRSTLDRCVFEESFRNMYQMYEDQAFLCKVYLNEKVYVSEPWHNLYRQRSASLVSSVYETGKYDVVRSYYLNWFEKYYKSLPRQYKRVTWMLRKALFQYRYPLLFKIINIASVKAIIARMLVKMGLLTYKRS
jgi:glycosyltransferase involved in cell wall biosynthesis